MKALSLSRATPALAVGGVLLLAPLTKIGEYQVGLGVDLLGAAIFAVVIGVNCLRSDSNN